MATVYTKRFALIALAAGATSSVTVPAGKVWILRDVTAGVFPGAAAGYVYLEVAGTAVAVQPVPGGAVMTWHWSGYLGARAGELLVVHNLATGAMGGAITGYEFDA